MKTRNLTIIGTLLCVFSAFFSTKLSLFMTFLFFSWITYQFLIKRDFTLLATKSFMGKEYDNLDGYQQKKYKLRAFYFGWLFLVLTVSVLIILINTIRV